MSDLKLSLWDAFTYFVSGSAALISIYFQLLSIGWPVNDLLSQAPDPLLGFAAFLIPLILGLLFEPIGNLIGKFIFCCSKWAHYIYNKIRHYCDRAKNQTASSPQIDIEAIVKADIPDKYRDACIPYYWAKDYLSQEGIDTTYMEFIAKFGFYRNMGALFLINAFSYAILSGLDGLNILIYSIILLLSAFYFWRCDLFFQHMGSYIYRHYVILLERTNRGLPERPPQTR